MGRFLIYFSYLGTRYSGVQLQKGVLVGGKPVRTVGGALQEALNRLSPANEVKITLSSRTDKGVHALKNACHVDLVYPCAGREYHPAVVTHVMNKHLIERGEDIRVLKAQLVPSTFNARMNAQGRKYVYRLGHTLGATSSPPVSSDESQSILEQVRRFSHPKNRHPTLVFGEPLDTLDSCKAVIYRTQLDIDKLISAAEMLSGIHNFKSFASSQKFNANHQPQFMKMLAIGVKRGQPFGHRLQKCGLDNPENIEFWDIHVRSRSFLFRQVRRLVGAMVLVARNIISFNDLRDILENPRKDFPFSGSIVAGEAGLFLVDIEYNPKDLELAQTTNVLSDQHLIQPVLDSDGITSSLETNIQDDGACEPSLQHSANDTNSREDDTDDSENLFSEDNDSISLVPSDKFSSASDNSTVSPKKVSECS